MDIAPARAADAADLLVLRNHYIAHSFATFEEVPLTRAAVHTIVKEVFARAAGRLRERGIEQAARADVLEKASAHWLRHTAGSHMADRQVDLRHVRDNFGHASLTTTSIYLHVDEDRRHQETDEKHRIDW